MNRSTSTVRRLASAAALLTAAAVLAAPAGAAAEPPGEIPAAAGRSLADVVGTVTPGSDRAATNGLIAFARGGQIRTIAVDGSAETVLTTDGGNSGPVWSPDGARIAYVHRDATGATDLWLMNADGSGPEQVTRGGGISPAGASWSPDGRWLAFGGPCGAEECAWFWDAPYALNVIRSSARTAEPLLIDPGSDAPFPGLLSVFDRVSWSPDGDHLAFGSNTFPAMPDDYLLVAEISTGWLDVVTSIGMSGLTGTLAYPAFNGDGTLLAYDAYIDAQGEIWHEGIELCDYPVTSCGKFRDVLHDTQLAFAPEGDKVLLVRALDRRRILVADPDGTSRRVLTRGEQPSWQAVPAR